MNARIIISAAAAVALLGGASPAGSQCMGGMAGMGHRHDEEHAQKQSTKYDKRIRELLSNTEARARLIEMIVEDEALVYHMLTRAFETPRSRAVASALLRVEEPGPTLPDPKGRAAADSASSETLYECPMHPSVVSHVPGSCPECGMTLERVPSRSGP